MSKERAAEQSSVQSAPLRASSSTSVSSRFARRSRGGPLRCAPRPERPRSLCSAETAWARGATAGLNSVP